MKDQRILLFHQGADCYGSDKIFYFVSLHLNHANKIKVVLGEDGPLRKKLIDAGIKDVSVANLSVLRRKNFKNIKSTLAFAIDLLRSIAQTRSLIREFRPNHVYVNTLAVISPLLCKPFFRSTQFTHHIHEIQEKPKYLFRALYSMSTLLSDNVICVSNAVMNCINNMSIATTNNLRVVYNGLPSTTITDDDRKKLATELNELAVRGDGIYIAYVARLHTWKGQLEFLDTLNTLVNERKINASVFFFGDCFPGYEYLKQEIDGKIKRLGLEKHAFLMGFRSDAATLFSICDISIMGSIEPDPLPTIVLESLQQGTPVIGYAHGGTVEMIEDKKSGFLVPPCNTTMMADTIEKYFNDRAKYHYMKECAANRFESTFSLAAFNQRFEQAITAE